MQHIQLNISDNIFDKVMFFLENLSKNNIGLTIENKTTKKNNVKHFDTLSLKTKNFKFDRDEANER